MAGTWAKILDLSQSREALVGLEARQGRISLGTPITRLIRVPENDFRVVGSASKRRTYLMLLDLRRSITEGGDGRLLATRP